MGVVPNFQSYKEWTFGHCPYDIRPAWVRHHGHCPFFTSKTCIDQAHGRCLYFITYTSLATMPSLYLKHIFKSSTVGIALNLHGRFSCQKGIFITYEVVMFQYFLSGLYDTTYTGKGHSAPGFVTFYTQFTSERHCAADATSLYRVCFMFEWALTRKWMIVFIQHTTLAVPAYYYAYYRQCLWPHC